MRTASRRGEASADYCPFCWHYVVSGCQSEFEEQSLYKPDCCSKSAILAGAQKERRALDKRAAQ